MKGKVFLFIVEGPSDEKALIAYIQKKMNEKRIKVTVKVMHTDIITNRNFNIHKENVVAEMKKYVTRYLANLGGYIKPKDVSNIYYVTDTDYCFFKDDENFTNKSNCLRELFKIKNLAFSAKNNPEFRLILVSKHLEHVISGIEERLTSVEKTALSNAFAIQSLKKPKFYVNYFLHNDEIMTCDSYEEFYQKIQTYRGAACNINNFIIENGLEEV